MRIASGPGICAGYSVANCCTGTSCSDPCSGRSSCSISAGVNARVTTTQPSIAAGELRAGTARATIQRPSANPAVCDCRVAASLDEVAAAASAAKRMSDGSAACSFNCPPSITALKRTVRAGFNISNPSMPWRAASPNSTRPEEISPFSWTSRVMSSDSATSRARSLRWSGTALSSCASWVSCKPRFSRCSAAARCRHSCCSTRSITMKAASSTAQTISHTGGRNNHAGMAARFVMPGAEQGSRRVARITGDSTYC